MKKGSYLFLFILIIILIFIIGMRYGQRIERTNKMVDSLMRITPQQITTTPIPLIDLISFTTYTHKGCGVKMLYPKKLSVLTESSQEAKLGVIKNIPSIVLLCDKSRNALDSALSSYKTIVSSRSAQLATVRATFYKHKTTNDAVPISVLMRHPQTGVYILLTVDERLIPLIQETLEFTSSYGNP